MSGLKNRKSTTNKDKMQNNIFIKVADKNELKDPVETTSTLKTKSQNQFYKMNLKTSSPPHHPHHEHDHERPR